MGMPIIEPVRIDVECAATALIQSIALEEAALAHILNAEGEKLQKAICLTNNVNDLIRINESVATMVENVSALENLFREKLADAISILNGKYHHKNCR